jgi:hypothetical protein
MRYISLLSLVLLVTTSTASPHVFTTFMPHENVSSVYFPVNDHKKISEYQKKYNVLEINNFTFYPSPGNGSLTLEFSLKDKKPVNIKIYNLIGRACYDEIVSPFEGYFRKSLPVNLVRGIYILRIEQEKKIASRKIMVE